MGAVDAAARLQRRLRDGCEGGLPVRLRRHGAGDRGLDVHPAHRPVRPRSTGTTVLSRQKSLGLTQYHRAPDGGRPARPVGTARPGTARADATGVSAPRGRAGRSHGYDPAARGAVRTCMAFGGFVTLATYPSLR